RLCGKACATSGRRITSASIRTMTSPRNASTETRREFASDLVSGAVTVCSAGLSSCANSVMTTVLNQQNQREPSGPREVDTRTFIPTTTRKIGKFLRSAMGRYRRFAQGRRRTPGSGVINIDVGSETTLQAIHQAVIHHVVHAPVAAGFSCHLTGFLPQRMFVFLQEGIDRLPLFSLLAIHKHPWRIVCERALGA